MISSFGNSGILNLANPDEGIFDTYLSLFTLKYFYPVGPGELFPGFEAMNGMLIKKTSKTSVICGFNCRNAEITLPSAKDKVYEIWYTNEINIKNPNAATPYSQIDGVLMSFFFVIGSSELHFEALREAQLPHIMERSDNAFQRTAPQSGLVCLMFCSLTV